MSEEPLDEEETEEIVKENKDTEQSVEEISDNKYEPSSDSEKDSDELEKEKKQIEKDLKDMAKQYESQEEEKPKNMSLQILTTISFIFGPILLFFLLIIPSWDFYRSVTLPLSGVLTFILFTDILFRSWRKSKSID